MTPAEKRVLLMAKRLHKATKTYEEAREYDNQCGGTGYFDGDAQRAAYRAADNVVQAVEKLIKEAKK